MPSLETSLCGIKLKTPFVLASGILGVSNTLLHRAGTLGAGAVTLKTIGPVERKGHANPICLDWGAGLINAVGLPGPGMDKGAEMIAKTQKSNKEIGVPVIASLFAPSVEEFAEVTTTLLQGKPDMVEVNISCPNVKDDFGEPFAANPDAAASVTEAVKSASGDVPVFIKLAPNVPNIARIAAAVVEAGADGITAINTVPGMVIDRDSGYPILTNKSGGLSGAAIKPVALKCVFDIRKACPDTPIIGTGGISCGGDAMEMLMAGATAVGVGSAVYYRGIEFFKIMAEELMAEMSRLGHKSIADVSGYTHRVLEGENR